MAGAVSAGAYTAGVLDYLIEALDNWEKAKAAGEVNVPNDYNVNIEIMSGASAGGITAALAALSLRQNHQPINAENKDGRNNLMYDCWVNMADDGQANNSIEKLLELGDLKTGEPVQSLFNSQVIDIIARKAVDYGAAKTDFPSYISNNLDIIMTVTNLNGLNYNIEFNSYQGASPSRLTMHSGFYRFRFDEEKAPQSDYFFNLDINKKEHRELITNAAKASGAFPVGLKARKESFSTKFIRQYSNSIFPELNQGNVQLDESVLKEEFFDFIAVDGGMINNEPYGFTYKNIKEKQENLSTTGQKDYSIIMVDPFPCVPANPDKGDNETGILSILPKLAGTLRNQVMFKQEDLLDALSDDNSTRFLIAPVRKVNKVAVATPIASGALGGFAGFFDKKFRQHDFELGRKNCQDFIRYYFAKKENEKHFIHEKWTDEMKERFRFYRRDQNGKNVAFLPIIPDVNVLNAIKHDYKVAMEKPVDFPEFDETRFDTSITPKIQKRLRKIVELVISNHLKNGFGRGLVIRFMFFIFKRLGPNFVAKRLSRKVEEIIRKEFKEFGLIK